MTWGHEVFKATPQTDWQTHCSKLAIGKPIGAGKCKNPAAYIVRYRYIAKGRASSSDSWVCEEHARRYASKHHCEILEAEPSDRLTDAERARRFPYTYPKP